MAMASKTCTRCVETKPLVEFSGHPKAADGKQSQCKACFAERARLRRVDRPCITCGQALSSDAKAWAKSCIECLSKCTQCGSAPRLKNQRICASCQAASDEVRKSNPDTKFKERVARIKSKYGVRPALAAALAATDVCECCGKKASRPGEIHVDHCHETGDVRGALCFNCNAALGHLNDDPERLKKLLVYLESKNTFKKIEDSMKARHFIDLLIELETRGQDKGCQQ